MEEDIINSLQILLEGGTILYPTDTIWGIGCDATNKDAIAKLYQIKKREDTKSMLILLDEFTKVYNYVKSVHPDITKLIKESSMPTTIIYPQAKNLPINLISSDHSIGIRITRDLFCQKLLKQFGKPIVSTSANISGCPFSGHFKDIAPSIKKEVDYIVKYRQKEKSTNTPSKIIKIEEDGTVINIR